MNAEHVEIVRRGHTAIAEWREQHPEEMLDLSGADLYEASLRYSDLSHADLTSAKLCGADLSDAILYSASLRDADLTGAYLWDAHLHGADLSHANLRGVDLFGAFGIWECGPGGSRQDMLWANIRENVLWLYTGCFAGTAKQFEVAVAATHGDNEHGRYYRAMLAAAKAWAQEQSSSPEA